MISSQSLVQDVNLANWKKNFPLYSSLCPVYLTASKNKLCSGITVKQKSKAQIVSYNGHDLDYGKT